MERLRRPANLHKRNDNRSWVLMVVDQDARGVDPMNDVQTHFVAVCPTCSSSLRVRRAYIGQLVVCKQCNMSFRAEEADQPSTTGSGSVEAGPVVQPWP